MKTARFYFPGIALLIIAFLVLSFPEVLIAFASGIIIIAGFFALYIGHKIRLFQSTAGIFEQRPFDNNFHKMSYANVWSKHNR
ncbi:MAG: hypothetical protein HN737_03550 [Desulfobacterales bacterium]|nr:hypothetical protein [Desulfobacteraceae bacterium]MBT4363784.1 hypothetical protein [Desulfobacteraceae bacterium]MBT7085633.1 hypothetical protein [Desulfobacterales bacterium]MBT7696467.1 hypothetical protein [Desulfobacterales bacterium]